mmetsp:Transcript_11670/g.29498  ORF Transcript_11670/g.29498 Transcript_11670/m.29498 type:complete len:382 (+) Transcript_11670:463-1608(+)
MLVGAPGVGAELVAVGAEVGAAGGAPERHAAFEVEVDGAALRAGQVERFVPGFGCEPLGLDLQGVRGVEPGVLQAQLLHRMLQADLKLPLKLGVALRHPGLHHRIQQLRVGFVREVLGARVVGEGLAADGAHELAPGLVPDVGQLGRHQHLEARLHAAEEVAPGAAGALLGVALLREAAVAAVELPVPRRFDLLPEGDLVADRGGGPGVHGGRRHRDGALLVVDDYRPVCQACPPLGSLQHLQDEVAHAGRESLCLHPGAVGGRAGQQLPDGLLALRGMQTLDPQVEHVAVAGGSMSILDHLELADMLESGVLHRFPKPRYRVRALQKRRLPGQQRQRLHRDTVLTRFRLPFRVVHLVRREPLVQVLLTVRVAPSGPRRRL